MSEEISIVKALRESIELLRGEHTRQRKLIGRLRKQLRYLRGLQRIQSQNDERFRSMCQEEL